ncbi:hypothetical protein RZN22_07990 [Bacillaceae bacterium S4-13-58]
MFQSKKNVLYTPWKAFIIYIVITLFLNFFGPWDYINYNKFLVLVYMMLFLSMGTFTYRYAISKSIAREKYTSRKPRLNLNPLLVTRLSIFVSLILYLYLLYEKYLMFGPPDFTNNIFETINSAYNDKGFTFTLSYWLYSYLFAFDILAKILGLYYFKKLSLLYRFMLILTFTLSLAYTILYDGNQKAVGDMIVYVLSVIILLYLKSNKKFKIRHIISILILVFATLYLFIANLTERISGWGWVPYTLDGHAYANYDHWMVRYLPEDLKIGGMAIFNYISNGYYGLSLCLQLPFIWSMGFGSSFAFQEIVTRWFNINDYAYGASYPVRMNQAFGYDGYVNWVSIFPWLASDFTFFGAIIFICVFIYIYAIAWYKSIKCGNWISIVLFAHLNIFLLYIPNNNQLFQTKTSFIATLVIFILWLIFKDTSNNELVKKR